MLAEIVRNGRVEAAHEGVVVISDPGGKVLASSGDADRPFFARSALKPFQGLVSQRHGAALANESLAVGCSSHAGLPQHLSVIRSMLAEAGLAETALQTPPSWPTSPHGHAAAVVAGATGPSPLFHNCSGKHAAVLRACAASGLSLDDYRDHDHVIQRALTEDLEDRLGQQLPEAGIDGCGLPAHVTTATDLARLFAGFAVGDEFGEIRSAMESHPVLIGDVDRADGVLSAAGFASKQGAEGCMGIAVPSLGIGIAIKAWDGSHRPIAAAASVALAHLGVLDEGLEGSLRTPVLGAGAPVGEVRPALVLA